MPKAWKGTLKTEKTPGTEVLRRVMVKGQTEDSVAGQL